MNDVASRPSGLGAVVPQQVRAVGAALRREAAVMAGLVGLLTVLVLYHSIGDHDPIDVDPDGTFVVALLGLLIPFAVWKGERLFGAAYLWTLPVGRMRHALIKVLAGWAWLMAVVAALIVWMLLLALITGGQLVPESSHYLIASTPAEGPLGPEHLTQVPWTMPAWQWIAPFTAASVAYLLGSTVVLGLKHPLRWGAGALVALVTVLAVGDERWIEAAIQFLFMSELGLDYVLSGGAEALDVGVPTGPDETTVAWLSLPSARAWASATALWLAIGFAALGVAAARHRES